MKYIGNYKDWIDPKWMETILSTPGRPWPNDWQPSSDSEANTLTTVKTGFNGNTVNWWLYTNEHLNLDITPPWCTNESMFWFVKMEPGQFFPLHKDPMSSTRRYWMAMQDYELGHILIWGESAELVKDYKMGDVFEFDASNVIHGASNISSSVRVMMQVSEEM